MKSTAPAVTIALADDHTLFRKAIIGLLDSQGFNVVAEACNGQLLVEQIRKLKLPPQVCLLDVSMPVMDGYHTLLHLRALYPEMKFLILTMHDEDFTIIRMLRNGVSGYLLKDIDPQELAYAIGCALQQQFYHSSGVASQLVNVIKGGKDPSKILVSDKEQAFLELCCTDLIYKEMAAKMGVSTRTVEGYRDDLFQRLGIKTRTGLVIYALKHGIINLS